MYNETGVSLMKAFMLILCMMLSASSKALLAETYEECVLENLKGVNDKFVMREVRSTCKRKTTPKKCREILDKPYEEFKSQETIGREFTADMEAMFKGEVEPLKFIDQETIQRKETALQNCIKECESEGMYSRHFGECSTD